MAEQNENRTDRLSANRGRPVVAWAAALLSLLALAAGAHDYLSDINRRIALNTEYRGHHDTLVEGRIGRIETGLDAVELRLRQCPFVSELDAIEHRVDGVESRCQRLTWLAEQVKDMQADVASLRERIPPRYRGMGGMMQ